MSEIIAAYASSEHAFSPTLIGIENVLDSGAAAWCWIPASFACFCLHTRCVLAVVTLVESQ
jgi:hypothetical protein